MESTYDKPEYIYINIDMKKKIITGPHKQQNHLKPTT